MKHHANRESDLRQSEETFRVMTENIHDVFWMATPGIREMCYVSPAYEKIWGRDPKRLYHFPKSFIEAIHPEERDVVQRGVEHHEKGIWDFEYRIVCPDGTIRWIRDRGYPVRDGEGKILRMCGVATDVTGFIQRQETLRQEKDALKAKVEERNGKLRETKARLMKEKEVRRRLEGALSRLILSLEDFRGKGFSFPIQLGHLGGAEKPKYIDMEEGSRDAYERLSLREREVFNLLADGEPIKVVANRLGISPKTVETHKYNIMDKLGIHKISDMTKIAIKNNLIPLC